jgi:hypothetical protein
MGLQLLVQLFLAGPGIVIASLAAGDGTTHFELFQKCKLSLLLVAPSNSTVTCSDRRPGSYSVGCSKWFFSCLEGVSKPELMQCPFNQACKTFTAMIRLTVIFIALIQVFNQANSSCSFRANVTECKNQMKKVQISTAGDGRVHGRSATFQIPNSLADCTLV